MHISKWDEGREIVYKCRSNLCIGWHKMVNVGGNIAVLTGVGRKSFLWKAKTRKR